MDPLAVPMSKETRKNMRCNWLASISEIANIERQREEWLRAGQQNPYYSLVEYRENYFDAFSYDSDCLEPCAVDFISAEEIAVVAEFHNLMLAYESPNGDDWDSRKILDDPKWQAVCAEAKNAKNGLKEIIKRPEMGCLGL